MKRFIAFVPALLAALTIFGAKPEIVAHRGHHRAPGSAQNSIRSLVKADSIKADKTEFDVWISADDVLYVNHNSDINGVVIETSTSEVIDTCHLKNGETIPRLDAFLDAAKNLDIDLVLELKPHKDISRENVAIPMIIDMVEQKGLTSRTTYITFSRNACELMAQTSGRPVQYLTGVSPDELKATGASGADFHISHFRTHPDWIAKIHAMGLPVNIWTVDSEEDILYCINHGADYITTNEPELAQRLVDEAYAPKELTIMTYNLRFGELASMERLAEEIIKYKPDFVALQEVDANTLRQQAKHNNGLYYINELAQRTGMFGYYGKTLLNYTQTGGYYGIGILSKYPAETLENIELPNPKNAEPRVMLKGLFQLDNGLPFIFASTHFDYKSDQTQLAQAKYLLTQITDATIPTVFAGDFNCSNDSEAFKIIETECVSLSGTQATFPAKNPTVRLDHIFGYPRADIKLISTLEGESGEDSPSDHIPVVSKILVTFK